MPGRPVKPTPKLAGVRRRVASEIGELVRKRAEAEAAIADARKSHERLREAIEHLPQGIVFLDAEGRYILWNKKYAEIYNRSADLFAPGARLADTIRIGVERGDYPEARGREEEWIAERLTRLHQPGARHEQTLADGRVILIEERLTSDGGVIGLRVDITELKQREASFRLLFDSNPVPMIVCSLDGERILAVNDAAIEHNGYSRADVATQAVAAARNGNAYSDVADAGVQTIVSTADRAKVYADAVAKAHDPLQSLDRRAFFRDEVPAAYKKPSVSFTRQAGL